MKKKRFKFALLQTLNLPRRSFFFFWNERRALRRRRALSRKASRPFISMSFFSKIANYLGTEVVAKVLANNKAFQWFALSTVGKSLCSEHMRQIPKGAVIMEESI